MTTEIKLSDLRIKAHESIVSLCEQFPVNQREIVLRFAVMYAFKFAEANKADDGQEGSTIIPDLLGWTHTIQNAVLHYAYYSDDGLEYDQADWYKVNHYGDMIDEEGNDIVINFE